MPTAKSHFDVYAFGYLSVRNYEELKFTDAEHAMRKFVKSIKGVTFKGSEPRIRDAQGRVYQIQNGKPENTLRLFGTWGATKLASLGIRGAYVTPIPSSQHFTLGQSFNGMDMAKAIEQASGGTLTAFPALAFQEAMPSASKNMAHGRNHDFILSKLKHYGTLTSAPFVLIDDVFTSGAHGFACSEYLQRHGATVLDPFICAGRTTYEQPPNPFDFTVERVANRFSLEYIFGPVQ